jgi:hypothetical protein
MLLPPCIAQVKQNFDRFISCKTTIDDIYVKLQRIESAGTGISTQVLFNAVQEVQGSAKRAFGPLLERHTKAERIKSVQVQRPGEGQRYTGASRRICQQAAANSLSP